MDEAKLFQKLRDIEALFSGATTDGERDAAAGARERILDRLREIAVHDPPVEYRFTLSNPWSKRLFMALLRRYELKPYRYKRQKHSTVMVKVPKGFVNETLWPQFERLNEELAKHLDEVADRVIGQAMQAGAGDVDAIDSPQASLPLGE